MNLTDDQLLQVEELSSLFSSIDEIALMIDVSSEELRREIRNKHSDVSKKYFKGKLETQIKLRKQTKLFAEKGSPQAEQTMKQLYEQQSNNE